MKSFYTLTEIERLGLTHLKSRALKTRIKNLVASGTIEIGTHLYKLGSYWQIHYTLLPFFQKRNQDLQP